MRTATLIRALSIAAFTVVASIGARAQETIKIGWLSSLTGPLSSAAIAENQGVQFAVEEINNGGGILGRKIVSARLHGIDNFRGRERLVRTDAQTPGFMRAPFEHAAAFAFESAIDELAYALEQDPVALRLANDTTTDPVTKRPLSSRHLAECLQRGAERFGWRRRTPAPGSMRADDGTLIGWGVAAGAYKASTAPAIAKLRVTDDGGVFIGVGVHEMAQGVRTALSNAVAAKLGVPPESVIAEIGVTGTTPQHVTAGSWGTATAIPAAAEAAEALLAELQKLDPNGTVTLIGNLQTKGPWP